MQIVKLKGAVTIREITLLVISVTIVLLSAFFIQQYAYLKSHAPFENVKLITTVNEQRRSLDMYATFDRFITCGAKAFEFHLTNTATGRIVVLTPADLLELPPRYVTPGANQEVRYAYAIPTYDVSGAWATKLVGVFECANGVFTAAKFQVIDSNTIIIE